jgi:hypothetical protein
MIRAGALQSQGIAVCRYGFGLAFLALLFGQSLALAATTGEWRQKTQFVWDGARKQLISKTLRVWDAEPQFNLEFYWEPAAGHPLQDGAVVEGNGTLTWRKPGTPNYDFKSIYSTYRGDMRNGRPHGSGRLDTHAGTLYEGTWAAGLMHGHGRLRFENGDEYTGEFTHGQIDGKGRYAAASGEIYEGEFAQGRRHGIGTVTALDGSTRTARWRDGAEVQSGSDRVFVQLKRQRAADVRIEITTNARMNSQIKRASAEELSNPITYTHVVGSGVIGILPDDERLLRIWKQGGAMYNMDANDFSYREANFDIPAFINIRIASRTAVSASSLTLEVSKSAVDNQPFLGIFGAATIEDEMRPVCGGESSSESSIFIPEIEILNSGWGAVINPRFKFSFASAEAATHSQVFTLTSDTFDTTTKFSVERELRALGADVDQLKSFTYQCPSYDQVESCRENALAELRLGGVAPYVKFGDRIYVKTIVDGTMSYQWKNEVGELRSAEAPFRSAIYLASVNVHIPSECGGGGPDLPEAGVPVFELSTGKTNYKLAYPLKRPVPLTQNGKEFGLAIFANKSSNHTFRVVAGLSDGRKVASPPIQFTYVRPKP